MSFVTSQTADLAVLAALHCVKALAESFGPSGEPYLAASVSFCLNACGAKSKPVNSFAPEACASLFKVLAKALPVILDTVFAACDQAKDWKIRVVALSAFGIAQAESPAALASCLPAIIPMLTPCMTDTKKEVKKSSKVAMEKGLKVVDNKDIAPVVGALVDCILKPALVPELIHKLGGVVFVQTIDSPALAVMVPLLVRGLRESATAVKRTTAVIIENMSKLVENPIEAAPFIPLLLPALIKGSETVSDPEARAVFDRAQKQLERLNGEILKVGDVGKTDPAVVAGIVGQHLKAPAGNAAYGASVAFASAMMAALIDRCVRTAAPYLEVVASYLGSFADKAAVDAAAPKIHGACVELIKAVPEEEEEADDKEILADVEFTLAYGTKILLHNTKLKLKRGNKYGLLGPNDCGKTTLMRSIAEGQIEGFPPPTELRTVFVEADILGELSHLNCTEYVLADPRIQADGITEKMVQDALVANHFNTKMLTDGVSTLSGG